MALPDAQYEVCTERRIPSVLQVILGEIILHVGKVLKGSSFLFWSWLPCLGSVYT